MDVTVGLEFTHIEERFVDVEPLQPPKEGEL
jgi:hypothetical protein